MMQILCYDNDVNADDNDESDDHNGEYSVDGSVLMIKTMRRW